MPGRSGPDRLTAQPCPSLATLRSFFAASPASGLDTANHSWLSCHRALQDRAPERSDSSGNASRAERIRVAAPAVRLEAPTRFLIAGALSKITPTPSPSTLRSSMAFSIPWQFLGLNVSGDLAGFTCYTDRYGKKVWYPKAPPETPETPGQRQQRDRFTLAVNSWKDSTDEIRTAYENVTLTASLCMTGHNLWISLSFSQDDRLRETLIRQTGIYIPLPPQLAWPAPEMTRTPAPRWGESKPTVRF